MRKDVKNLPYIWKTPHAFLVLGIRNDLFELMKWNCSNGLNAKKIMNQWRLHMVHLNGPTKNEIINHQQEIIWHVWKKEWTVRMESHLFMLVIVVSSLTRLFVVSKTNESTLMCQSNLLGWFKSMYGYQA